MFARSHLVACLAEVGSFDESARYADEAMALAETTNHPDTLFWAYHGKGIHHLSRGEVRPAAEALERAYSVCQTHDMPTYRPRISAELGLAWAQGGQAAKAVPMVQQAAEEAAARRQVSRYSHVLLLLAEVYVLADRLAEAAEAATRALAQFRQRRERGHEAHALWVLGDVAARQYPVKVADAEAYYNAARAAAETLGMRPLLARCELGLGRLRYQVRQVDRARQAIQSACVRFDELGMSADLARGKAELGALT